MQNKAADSINQGSDSSPSLHSSNADFQQQAFQQYLIAQQNQLTQQQDDEIDLAELWHAIWSGKLMIIFISLLFSIASIVYALSQPNIYKASTLLAPASQEGGAGGLGALAGQFGGLASLAGINLGGSGGDKTAVALEVIKSRSFLEAFISKHQLLIPLMAANNWDATKDSLMLDDEIYNQENQTWVRDVKAPKKPEPSSWEAYKEFLDILNVSQDKTTSMVTISIEFYSPEIAKQWLLWLVQDINEYMREQDQKEAQRSIDYLTKQLENIQLKDMSAVFYQLIEEQTKSMMLTQVKAEYVLKTIDPSQTPDEKDKPKRALIVVLGTMLGGILSVLIVLVRYFTQSKTNATP